MGLSEKRQKLLRLRKLSSVLKPVGIGFFYYKRGQDNMSNRSLLALVAYGVLSLNAQKLACTTEQVPGAMTSWAGQPGTQDHTEKRAVSQGTVLACEAVDAPGSPLPAGCNVSVEGGGRYTVPAQKVIRTPNAGAVTLTCNGPSPTCCRVRLTEDQSPLKHGDTKPHKQNGTSSSVE